MNITVTGHHVVVTDAIRDYVTAKMEKVTRLYDEVISISVILSVDKLEQKAEVTVRVRGKEIFVESKAEDLYAAIDGMEEKISRQIVKYKQKQQDRGTDSVRFSSGEE